jgi:tetratricopeptide (TPR) repeat protein
LARLTRQEILKEDRFMMVVDQFRHFFANNRSEILRGLSAAGVVAVFVAAFYYYSAKQEGQSKEELAKALTTYHAPVSQGGEAASSSSPDSIATSTRNYEKALVELQGVIARHDTRPAGKIATYYAGLCLHRLDRNAEAISQLEPLSQEQTDFGALALAALGRIYEDSADIAKATEVYQQLVDRNALTTPGDRLAMHMALLYEHQDKNEEAAKIYEKVIQDFPASPVSSEAELRLKKIAP